MCLTPAQEGKHFERPAYFCPKQSYTVLWRLLPLFYSLFFA